MSENPYQPPQTESRPTSSPPFSLRRLLIAITMASSGAILLVAVRYPSFGAFSPVGAGTYAVVLIGTAAGVVAGTRRWIAVGAGAGFVVAMILWHVFYGVTPLDLISSWRL